MRAMETLDVVKNLALDGRGHFHASVIADEVGISTDEAHEQLVDLQAKGIVTVNFDVICPDNLRTIKTFHLREEIPWDEWVVEPTGDCEPFKLTEEDIDVTYSPTYEYTQRLLRNGERPRSKKKSPMARVGNLFRPFRLTKKRRTGPSSSISTSKTAPAQRSSRRRATALPGR
jgi:hypothetical protein